MKRSAVFALIASFQLAVPLLAFGQTHAQPHAQGPVHGPDGHLPLDPAEHAALHGGLTGDWAGTLNVAERASHLDLKISTDSLGNTVFRIAGDRDAHLGPASQIAVDARKVTWTQEVSGKPCTAAAEVVDSTSHDPAILKGTVSCAHGELTFALRQIHK